MTSPACINLQNRVWTQPNAYNAALNVEARCWRRIIQGGGLEATCAGLKSRRYQSPPWEKMPQEGERVNELGSIVIPVNPTGSLGPDTPVLDFTMDVGWDGVFTNVMMTSTDSSFVQGSGDLVWRLKIGERWIPDFSAVIFEENDLRLPHALVGGYIRVLSLQRVRIFVAVGPGANPGRLDPASRVNAGLAGWKYPKR